MLLLSVLSRGTTQYIKLQERCDLGQPISKTQLPTFG